MNESLRRTVLPAFLAATLAAPPGASAAAAPPTLAASTVAAASPAPAASCGAGAGSVVDAFAYELTNESVLRFLSLLATAPDAEKERILGSAVTAARAPETAAALAAVAKLCPDAATAAATGRAVSFVAQRWVTRRVDEATDRAMVDELSAAAFALSEPARLDAADARGALLPFATLLPAGGSFADAETSPSPSPPPASPSAALRSIRGSDASCDVPNATARTIVVAKPNYPPVAVATHVTGSVTLKIALSATGSVRAVTVYGRSLPDGAGARDIVDAAIVAAAATTYAPATVGCRRLAAYYLFRANFDAQR